MKSKREQGIEDPAHNIISESSQQIILYGFLPFTVTVTFVLYAIPAELFAMHLWLNTPPVDMFLLHIPRLLLPFLTGTPFSNNWYVATGGFPSAEQLKVTTEPWHTVDLLTVNLNFSGLSVGF